MVLSYNSRLKPMDQKGLCGDPETFNCHEDLVIKVEQLARLVEQSHHTVVFTGAGISTSSGIADFRGPTGVWTKEIKGIPVTPEEDTSDSFNKAIPSLTHNALYSLLNVSKVHHIISQNVDGLHMRSGVLSDQLLTELHGNIFIEDCVDCRRKYFRDNDVGGMGLAPTGNYCIKCGGVLIDNAVDWDTELPKNEFSQAERQCSRANLIICLGTSLRIRPAGNLPRRVLKDSDTRVTVNGNSRGNLVIVNLQSTHLDKVATIKINHYCDEVMKLLCERLNVEITATHVNSCVIEPSRKRYRKKIIPKVNVMDLTDSSGSSNSSTDNAKDVIDLDVGVRQSKRLRYHTPNWSGDNFYWEAY